MRMPMNYLINADDYGLTHETNESINDLIELGVINSVSILANFVRDEDLIVLNKLEDKYGIEINLHVNILEGKILSKEMREFIGSDTFKDQEFWIKLPDKKLPEKESIAELEAHFNRIEKFIGEGTIDGIDFHGMYPYFLDVNFNILKSFAEKHNLRIRGNDIGYRGMNSKELAGKAFHEGTINLMKKALRFPKLFSELGNTKKVEGSYISDMSLTFPGTNPDELATKIRTKLDSKFHDKPIEFIVHVNKIIDNNLPLAKDRYETYHRLKEWGEKKLTKKL